MKRREFIGMSGLAAAGLLGGCTTQKVAWKPDGTAFIKAALLHLGSNRASP